MRQFNLKKCVPHVIAIAIFLLLTVIYFSPYVFDNKDIVQGDVTNVQGWGKDLKDYHKETGEYAFWSNTMFSGMPSNQTYQPPTVNVFNYLHKIFTLNLFSFHMGIVFIYMLGFYIFLLALGCKSWISIIGAIGYAFASYNFIIIEAGHVNKGLAMATIAPVLGGVILCYRKNYLWGALVTLIFAGIHISYGHVQISYYLVLMLAIIVVVYFTYAIKDRFIKSFMKSSLILLLIGVLAFLPSTGRLMPMQDYSKDSIRGGMVLKNTSETESESSGLDIDYAFQWSYGKAETMTLLIPNFYGASSHYNLGRDSESYNVLKSSGQGSQFVRHAPTYWGAQSFTSGPVYAGAIICFLFILGLFVVKGPEKWWLLITTIFSILLSWGKNFLAFNEFLFLHMPMYDKFRTPSMTLIIAGVSMAALAALALKEIIENRKEFKEAYLRPLYISAGITGGLCLLFALFGGTMFSFSAPADANYPEWLVEALKTDRKNMMTSDAWRSLVFILFAAGLLFAYLKYKIKAQYILACLGVLILVDLWSVDKRFLNDDNFVAKKKAKQFEMTDADRMILQDKDPNYRVLNLTVNPFGDASTSYFHKSIGGYSGAKMRRYQDMIEHHMSSPLNMDVLNMLNARYFIVQGNNGPQVQRNPMAMGNAWFVDTLVWVDSPDDEIAALTDFNPATKAFVDKKWANTYDYSALSPVRDETTKIELTNYANPGNLFYESNSPVDKLAIFSEVFYKTWKVFIDGKEVPLIQANYILRALPVPAGKHTIEFRCVDEVFNTWSKVSLWSSIFVGLVIMGLILLLVSQYRKKKHEVNLT